MLTTAKISVTLAVIWLICAGCTDEQATSEASPVLSEPGTVVVTTADSVTIYGEPYFGDLNKSAPLILLFHQGGSDGRGEYTSLAPWLNEGGFRAIAWDQRAGGERLGGTNRTVAGLREGTPAEYCDAYADLEAALEYVVSEGLADEVVVWGSSYSAALVFRLAAEHPDKISGVLSFSPAAGGPLVNCRARMWLDELTVPAFALRPASEMELESAQEQQDIFEAAGVDFLVVENGVHGSSMLVDTRTNSDMSATRATVLAWLSEVVRSD